MSVWSRSHSDLARLAKGIHDLNHRTRLGLTQRNGDATGTPPPHRTRSLSPGAFPLKGLTDAKDGRDFNGHADSNGRADSNGHAESNGRTDPNCHVESESSGPTDSNGRVDLNSRTDTNSRTFSNGHTDSDNRRNSNGNTDSHDRTHSNFRTDSNSRTVTICHTNSTYSDIKTNSASESSKTLRTLSRSGGNGLRVVCEAVDDESLNGTSSPQTTPRVTVSSPDGDESSHSDVFLDSMTSELGDVFGSSPSTPILKHLPHSSAPDAPSSPRLSSRSPGLLNKLKEMTFSISSNKSDQSVCSTTRETRSPSPEKLRTQIRSPSPEKFRTQIRSPSPEKLRAQARSPSPAKFVAQTRSLSPEQIRARLSPVQEKRCPLPEKERATVSKAEDQKLFYPKSEKTPADENVDNLPESKGSSAQGTNVSYVLLKQTSDLACDSRVKSDAGSTQEEQSDAPHSLERALAVEQMCVAVDELADVAIDKDTGPAVVKETEVVKDKETDPFVDRPSREFTISSNTVRAHTSHVSRKESAGAQLKSSAGNDAVHIVQAFPEHVDTEGPLDLSMSSATSGPLDLSLSSASSVLTAVEAEQSVDTYCNAGGTALAVSSAIDTSVPSATPVMSTVAATYVDISCNAGGTALAVSSAIDTSVPSATPVMTTVAAKSVDTSCNAVGTSSTVSSAIESPPSQLRVCDLDLRLVPLSAIGIVVGSKGAGIDFTLDDSKSAATKGPQHPCNGNQSLSLAEKVPEDKATSTSSFSITSAETGKARQDSAGSAKDVVKTYVSHVHGDTALPEELCRHSNAGAVATHSQFTDSAVTTHPNEIDSPDARRQATNASSCVTHPMSKESADTPHLTQIEKADVSHPALDDFTCTSHPTSNDTTHPVITKCDVLNSASHVVSNAPQIQNTDDTAGSRLPGDTATRRISGETTDLDRPSIPHVTEKEAVENRHSEITITAEAVHSKDYIPSDLDMNIAISKVQTEKTHTVGQNISRSAVTCPGMENKSVGSTSSGIEADYVDSPGRADRVSEASEAEKCQENPLDVTDSETVASSKDSDEVSGTSTGLSCSRDEQRHPHDTTVSSGDQSASLNESSDARPESIGIEEQSSQSPARKSRHKRPRSKPSHVGSVDGYVRTSSGSESHSDPRLQLKEEASVCQSLRSASPRVRRSRGSAESVRNSPEVSASPSRSHRRSRDSEYSSRLSPEAGHRRSHGSGDSVFKSVKVATSSSSSHLRARGSGEDSSRRSPHTGHHRTRVVSENSPCRSLVADGGSRSFVPVLDADRSAAGGSDRSLVSASVQVSLSEGRSRSSRSHRRHGPRRASEERHGGKQKADLHGQSFSSSSVDSLLTVSDNSGYSSEVLNYLTSASSAARQGLRSVDRRRLRKLLRGLRHQPPEDDSASSSLGGGSGLSDFTRTVADLRHMCVSLSRNIEQQHIEEQRQRLLAEQQQQLLRERSLQEQQQRESQKEEEQQQQQRVRATRQREEQQRLREAQLQERVLHQQLQVRIQQQQQHVLLQQREQQIRHHQQQQQQEQERQKQQQEQERQKQQHLCRKQEQEVQERHRSEDRHGPASDRKEEAPAKEDPHSKRPFRLRLQNPSPQKRAADIRKLRRSSDATPPLKSPRPDPPPAKRTCLFHNLPTSARDLNQALIEEACKNTELLERLGVDKDVFTAGDSKPASVQRSRLPYSDDCQTGSSGKEGKKGNLEKGKRRQEERDLTEKAAEREKEEQGKQEVNKEGEAEEKGRAEEVSESEAEMAMLMQTPEEAVLKLDDEFDRTLVDMKPHVLKLPHKSDRQKCAVWIKKLCEPPSSGITGRRTRNSYAQLMLHMLKRGSLQTPFERKPDDGPLQPLPSYMSIYFDDPLERPDDAEKLPDWVEGELGHTAGSSLFQQRSEREGLGNPAATSTWVSTAGSSLHGVRQRPHTSMGIPLDKDPGLSPIRGDHRKYTGYSADDLSMEVERLPPRTHSPERRQLPDVRRNRHASPERKASDVELSRPLGVTGYSSTASYSKGGMFHDETSLAKPSDKEVALRTKMIEAKFHEEKLRLQQRHDAAVQKILDRKNSEIEDVKGHYRSKSKEYEETITRLERKVQTMMKESGLSRETKDKQINELKKMVEDSSDTQRNEYDKRMHDLEADFEQQKFELQKLHTRNIQEILDDTNSRLQRMEAEYNQQASTTTNVIKELESRVQQLMGEVDRTLTQRSALEREKVDLQSQVDKLTGDLDEQRHRNERLEKNHQKKLESSEHEMRSLRNKTEASLEYLKQEHNIATAKATDTISDQEQQVEYLKKALKDAEEHRQRQMRETEQVHQQDKLHLENLHDKQVRSMKKELEQLEQEMQRKLSRLEQLVKDKETEVQKQKEMGREQSVLGEKALDEFKQQVEKNQNNIYADMRHQMEQVEADLKKSKTSREKQSREFTRQLEEQRYKHEHELQELRMCLENEKAQLLHETHMQKEYSTTEHERDSEALREAQRTEMKALELRYKERQEKDAKLSGELESQVVDLREELVQANQLRKQQLVELGLLREEEKQKMQRDHQADIGRFRSDGEQQRLQLQKMHSAETERLLEKTNDRLKSIEREYMEKGKKSSETISELNNSIKHLRDDIKRAKENAEGRVADVRSQSEEEKQSLKKQYSGNLSMIQHELQSQRTRVHNLERQIQKLDADHEEKTTRLKQEHVDKMRGMLPGEIKQELEDTISSLKSQVNTLQQRAAMLQEELDLRLKHPLGQFGSRTSSPIKS